MNSLIIKVGNHHTIKQIEVDLIDLGYFNPFHADIESGQFFHLGGLIKIFPVNTETSFSIDFFGDQVEKIYSEDRKSVRFLEIEPNYLELLDNSKARPENYVVHEDHGIGIFTSIGVRKLEGKFEKYIKIAYLNNDFLYIPFPQIQKLSSYVGVGRRKPRVNKLGSIVWKKTYKKVYEDIISVARELLSIYAKRELVRKKERVINNEWESEVVRTFGFRETADQISTINSVYDDLTTNKPMDRLICGDVGFGKTEIAIRAAVQTIANGYQVAMLVPTTILAEQHYANTLKRLSRLPICIERISRLVESESQRAVLDDAKLGKLDMVIGTHSIIRSKIDFKNLGLLIIDEEQKFGVRDKEAVKQFREDIDVLTLTATPIPRTLFMSLSGIRDISYINSIPEGRKSIETKVTQYDDEETGEYIERELNRNGQVYYLHNEVRTIEGKVNKLRRSFPNVTIEGAHGQMDEKKLSQIMSRFASGEIKILVCSTIIENGLDLANVNTLIVDDADRFGLAQLYQIRGRIGRSRVQAYSLFTYKEKKITQNAVKRLKALLDNIELGTGFNIALSDLEIRGGGNILGKKQHGNMESVGLVLYSKMLKIAVERIKKS